MEDNQFLDAVVEAIAAMQNFLDTDATYGPTDPRTQVKKERLAQTIQALTPTNTDVPHLYVVRDEAVPQRELQPEPRDAERAQYQPRERTRRSRPDRTRDGWDRER